MGIVCTLKADVANVNLDLQRCGAAGGPGTGRTLHWCAAGLKNTQQFSTCVMLEAYSS